MAKNRTKTDQNELEQRDRRIKELLEERDEERAENAKLHERVDELVESLEEWARIFDGWEEAYGDLATEWQRLDQRLEDDFHLRAGRNALARENAALADLVDERRLAGTLNKREPGRPIAADAEQRAEVFRLHDEGVSGREIAAELELGRQTVRTLLGKITGRDRTSRMLTIKRLMRKDRTKPVPLNRKAVASLRARKRMRDAWPKRLASQRKRSEELVREVRRAPHRR